MVKYLNQNNEVGVIVAFMGKWYTNHENVELVMDGELIKILLDRKELLRTLSPLSNKIQELDHKFYSLVKEKWSGTFDVNDLNIRWVPVGEEFLINEYYFGETIDLKRDLPWIKA